MSATYDYLIVGGGTAGSLLAGRLSEDPSVTVGLLEWGPDDRGEPRARSLRRWAEMLEGEYDLDYRSVPQQRGNSGIRQARMRILGGCSNANTMIAWRPLPADLREWVALGADGWGPETIHPYYDRLRVPIQPVAAADRNPYVAGVVAAASAALGLPPRERWNDGSLDDRAHGRGGRRHERLRPRRARVGNREPVRGGQRRDSHADDGEHHARRDGHGGTRRAGDRGLTLTGRSGRPPARPPA